MIEKTLPCVEERIKEIISEYPTPFHMYDESGIRDNARRLYDAFSWVPGFKNFFAVKALPNPHILKILKEEDMGADCSSLPELILAEAAGMTGEGIMFTSNATPAKEYQKAKQLGVVINLDDISHIPFLQELTGMPELICFRYNPGAQRSGNAIIGNPEEAKYGFTRPQLFAGYKEARDLGAKRFGIHTMVVSNELNHEEFVKTAEMLFDLAIELKKELGIRLEFVNLGGGIGIPYKPEQEAVDLQAVSDGVHQAYQQKIVANDLDPLNIFMENGRMVTGPYGYLVAKVLHLKREHYRDYVQLDACMTDLARPAMYGAYHHITVLGKEDWPHDHVYDVVGGLCENNDKFAIQRKLPEIEPGDTLVIHDTGAHGHAMGSNYNGKLRSAELLLEKDWLATRIRRPETVQDYFATLDYPGLGSQDI